MKSNDLRQRVKELRDELMRFAGPVPKRGRRANALYVGLAPLFALSQHLYEDPLEVLKTINPNETIDLLRRLGKPMSSISLLLDYQGKWTICPLSPEGTTSHVFASAPYEVKLANDGWVFPMHRPHNRGLRTLRAKF